MRDADLAPRPLPDAGVGAERIVVGSWSELPVGRLAVPEEELSLPATLASGQAFRWALLPPDSRLAPDEDAWWVGVVGGRAIRLRREGTACLYQICPQGGDGEELLRRYFRLDVNLPGVVAELADRDDAFRPALAAFPGLRLLAQGPEEALLSYLCSPANSVLRISRSIDLLARRHGRLIARLDGVEHHAFPSLAALAGAPESDFRSAGLGWRGAGIRAVARLLLAKPSGWLAGLAALPYVEAKGELLALPSVGPKIADCVCLFGLCQDEAVPVDTHVWALARQLFAAELGSAPRSLTRNAYERILRLYQARYGPFAGWAQQYLYHWRRQGYPS